jgi:hypothetical protein
LLERDVRIFNHAKPNWLERWWRTGAINQLEHDGIRVELLEPFSLQGSLAPHR